ncbi:MAG TPA: PilT/PilU family type 4a pilus ATPase, partial [Dehalococcoidales bacterium]|nr:PilT/PilU family type 4a pilus ATPase [Dehalococcoidales bacterium]
MVYIKKEIPEILQTAVNMGASDVHIKVGLKPAFRIRREIELQADLPRISEENTLEYLDEITTDEQRDQFNNDLELDFAYSVAGIGRFRVNAYCELGTVGFVFRRIPQVIPDFRELGLPDICADLCLRKSGLVILTGPAGSGKTTTLAAMINYMNKHVKRRIITVEDPIEFVYESNECVISQREIGTDTHSFAEALRHITRQDPEVIVVGEMRDIDSMTIAINGAETGHLILTTLHTPSSRGAIEYIVGSFPPYQQEQIRIQLSSTLEAVLYQMLLPRTNAEGLIPAVE